MLQEMNQTEATPPQLSIAVSAGVGSARLMSRMKTGTLVFLRPATKAARVSWLHPPASSARQQPWE
jgi:hypothetical protein